MSGEGSSDHLPINLAQEYRVKLGKSFTFPEENAFHTLKYDFKPQSVDPSRPGHLIITDEGAVNVSLPVGQGELGDDYAQFRGPKKNCIKECILIIDTETEEAILERISDTVQLKATRDNRKHVHIRDRSVSPSPLLSQSKAPPPKLSYKNTTHLTPSMKPHPTSSGLSASKKPKSSSKGSGVLKTESLGKMGGAGGSVGGGGTKLAGSKGKGAEKARRGKLVKSSSQPTKPFQMASSSGLVGGGINEPYSAPDISPLRSSTNPTPEPGALPAKRPKLSTSSSSSSSSGSSSSDPESMSVMEDMSLSHAHHMRPVTSSTVTATAMSLSTRPAQSPQAEALKVGGAQKAAASSSQTGLFHSQKGASMSRSSSAGRPIQGHASGRSSVPLSSEQQQKYHQFLAKSSSAHSMVSTAPHSTTTQAPALKHQSAMLTSDVSSRSSVRPSGGPMVRGGAGSGGSLPTSVSRPANMGGSARPTTVVEMVVSSSGSSSASDSSSDSSSSDSSSGDSETENDREVAHVFSHRPPPPPPARQMSMSVLRSDLDLSESGSDSD